MTGAVFSSPARVATVARMPTAQPITLWVDDLVVTSRKVVIPAACPACGASLVAPAREPSGLLEPLGPAPTLVHEELCATTRGAVVRPGGEVDDALDELPEVDDAFLSASWACAACGEVLAEGRCVDG